MSVLEIMTSMRDRLIAGSALALLLLPGCGDYSNPALKEDLEFLMAVPSRSALELRVAEPTARLADRPGRGSDSSALTSRTDALGELATYYGFTAALTADMNRGIFGFLEVVDLITHLIPPTVRERNRRIWGPWPSDSSVNREDRFELKRIAPGVFSLKYQHRDVRLKEHYTFDSGWVDCVFGNVSPHGSLRRGQGNLTIDLQACGQVDQTGERGAASVGFDTAPDEENPDGKTSLSIVFDDFLSREEIDKHGPNAPALNATYAYREMGDLSGSFDFAAWTNLHDEEPGLEALERIEVRVRWDVEGAGRADARLSQGDLGTEIVDLHECWDEAHARVYYEDTHGIQASEGSDSSCALPATPLGG